MKMSINRITIILSFFFIHSFAYCQTNNSSSVNDHLVEISNGKLLVNEKQKDAKLHGIKRNISDTVQTDEHIKARKIKLSNALHSPQAKSNTISPNSDIALTSSFNHTDATAQLSGTSKLGFTYNLSAKQTVSGSDSTAIPLNLDGITSGSIIKLSFQNNTVNNKKVFGLFYNCSFTYNPKTYSYATDSFSLSQKSSVKNNWSISGTIGYVFTWGKNGNWTNLFSINYEYANAFKSAGDMSFIAPFGTSKNFYTINDLAFGTPKMQQTNVGTFEWKSGFGNESTNTYKLGWAIDISYSDQQKYAIQLPIYFINGNYNKTTALEGGIRLGYTNNTNNSSGVPTVELFVTTPFQILNDLTQ